MKKNNRIVEFGKTRSYGAGSFTRDPRNGNWIYKKVIDGKRISRSAKTQNECLKKMKVYERKILTGKILGKADDSDVMDQTLQDSISTWLYDVKRPTIKKSSYFDTLDTAYRNQLMDSELGRSKLKDITPHKIQIYLNCQLTITHDIVLIGDRYYVKATSTVVDYGKFYVINNCELGDCNLESYKIDKTTGSISDFSFLEYLDEMKKLKDDEELPEYEF